jgi:hypothetical protein
VVVAVLVVLLVIGGAAALLVARSRRTPKDEATISSADRIEGSFSAAEATPPRITDVEPPAAPASVSDPEPAADAPAAEESPPEVSTPELSEEDEIAAARFRPLGERSVNRPPEPDTDTETVPTLVVHHLEADHPASEPAPVEETPTGVEGVVTALIERVRTSDDDMVSVVSEMIEQDLDTEQMEEVLTELVERDRSARADRDELTLSGPDVPQRPGRLSAFADMPEAQKRRVIIRVLCLLIARSEELDPVGDADDRPEYTVMLPDDSLAQALAEPTARDLWGEPETDARDAHLPARRRRLARSRH